MTYFHINENKLPYLEELDLSNNKLNKFQISNLHSLKIVDISSNQIHVLDQHNLNHFRNLKNLISVDLSSNCLHQICSLETLFKDNQNLENLNLENNFLSLIEIFSVIKSVKRLNLSNNFLRSIPKNTFKNLVCLKELDLSFNGWTNYDWIDELSGSLENISIQNFSSLDVVVDQFKHFPLEKLSINEKLNQKAKKVYQIDTYLKENIDIFTILLKKGLTNDWMNNFNNESDISKLNQEINDLKYILSKEKSKNIFESHIRNEILMKFFFFLENNDMKENIAWNIWRTGISVENILEEVKNEFLGLDNVIEQLNIIGNSCLLKLSKGEKIEKDNFIFIGQPGTGKTTLARKLSKLFYAFGLITSPDKFIEKGNNLKGSVVGKAQENLIKSFEEAKGGILFIDEAYSLLSSDYGKEVIDTLVQQMTLDTTDAIVIIAGYEKEMDEFLNYNSGLSRRFQTVIDFGYYDEKALMNIFNNLKGNLTLDSSAMKILQDFFQKNKGNPTFGNAGGVIKLIKNINKMLSKEVTILTSNENEIVSGNILRSAIASLNKMIDEKIVKILRTCKMEGYGHRFRGFNLHTFSQLTEKDLRNDFNISNVSDRKTILQYAQYFSYCKHPATTSIVLDLIEFQFISIYDAIEIIFQFLHFDSSFFQNVISFLLKNYENLDDLLKLTKKELESSYDALYKEIDDFLNSVEIKKKMNEELEKSFDGIPSLNHWSKDENLKLLVNIRKEIKNHKIKMITQEFKNQFRTLIDYFQKKKNFKNLVPFFEEIQAELKELTKLGLKNDVHNYHYIPQIQKKLQNEEDSNMQCEKLLKLISEATLYSKNHSHQNQVKLIHIDNHNSLNEKIEDLKVNKTDFENAKKGKIRSIMIILDITNLLENEIFHVSKTSLSILQSSISMLNVSKF
eukprot:gene6112-10119_t